MFKLSLLTLLFSNNLLFGMQAPWTRDQCRVHEIRNYTYPVQVQCALERISPDGVADPADLPILTDIDLTKFDSDHSEPLVFAICNQHYGATRFLLEHGTDANQDWGNLGTPLHSAVMGWMGLTKPKLVALLLEHGARTDVAHEFYGTPLELALNIKKERLAWDIDTIQWNRRDHKQEKTNSIKIATMLVHAAKISKEKLD